MDPLSLLDLGGKLFDFINKIRELRKISQENKQTMSHIEQIANFYNHVASGLKTNPRLMEDEGISKALRHLMETCHKVLPKIKVEQVSENNFSFFLNEIKTVLAAEKLEQQLSKMQDELFKTAGCAMFCLVANVAKTTDDTAKTTDHTAKTTDHIAKTTDHTAKTTDHIAKTTDDTAKKIEDLRDSLHQVLGLLQKQQGQEAWKPFAPDLHHPAQIGSSATSNDDLQPAEVYPLVLRFPQGESRCSIMDPLSLLDLGTKLFGWINKIRKLPGISRENEETISHIEDIAKLSNQVASALNTCPRLMEDEGISETLRHLLETCDKVLQKIKVDQVSETNNYFSFLNEIKTVLRAEKVEQQLLKMQHELSKSAGYATFSLVANVQKTTEDILRQLLQLQEARKPSAPDLDHQAQAGSSVSNDLVDKTLSKEVSEIHQEISVPEGPGETAGGNGIGSSATSNDDLQPAEVYPLFPQGESRSSIMDPDLFTKLSRENEEAICHIQDIVELCNQVAWDLKTSPRLMENEGIRVTMWHLEETSDKVVQKIKVVQVSKTNNYVSFLNEIKTVLRAEKVEQQLKTFSLVANVLSKSAGYATFSLVANVPKTTEDILRQLPQGQEARKPSAPDLDHQAQAGSSVSSDLVDKTLSKEVSEMHQEISVPEGPGETAGGNGIFESIGKIALWLCLWCSCFGK